MTTIGAYEALSILMTGPASWSQGVEAAVPSSVSLSQGWNSVCYGGQSQTTEAATAGITGQFSVLYSLASDQSWKRFVSGRPEISNLPNLTQFAAVLILATVPEGTTWTFGP